MANSLNAYRGLNCGTNHQLRPFLCLQSLKAILSLWWSYILRTLLSCASPNRVSINIVSALLILTFIRLASFLWDIGNSGDPDQTPQNAASGQGLHCLFTECSIKT